ncbi:MULTISPECIES: hypothetical protein [unclassified Chryseobacterium]|uniref:hypothetical protein n=1 Tax=unclassified Chryseobacterium TaxID=2593645 RepID=UPI000F45527B|nr:hypothetical protein [Chryseobacterium sp. G0240]ROI05058.1 hypothetical protein EGI16_06970 [Chryseobacterium sp. G0240]
MRRIYFYEETRISVFLFETLITSIFLGIALGRHFQYNWAYHFLSIPAIFLLLTVLFLRWALTRYAITLFYSMLYGILGYSIGTLFQQDSIVLRIIFAYIAFFMSIILHEIEYRALKSNSDN